MVDKNKSNYLWIGIVVVAVIVIVIIFISNSNNTPQDSVTCNSPYIKVGNSCCLDQNSNNICDNDEEQKPIEVYATSDDLKTKVYWNDQMQYIDNYPKRNPNCNQDNGDIWAEISIINQEVNIVDYSCNSEILEGDKSIMPTNSFLLKKNQGYNGEGKVGVSQNLRESFSVKICCYPYGKIGYSSYQICKTSTLNPYC